MFQIFDIYHPYSDSQKAPCGKNAHGSTITELPSGEIMAVWYAGAYEKCADVGIWTSRFDPKTKQWSPIALLEKESPKKSEGNPVIYYDNENKRLWLFWVTMQRADYKHIPGGWSTCKMKCKSSDDLGKTWTPSKYLYRQWGKMTRNKPIRLSNGDVILPIYTEFIGYYGNFLIATKEEFAKGALKTKWIRVPPLRAGVEQPTVVEIELGHIIAHFRAPSHSKFYPNVGIAESMDYGRHWSAVRKGELYNPNSGSDMVKLQSGNIAYAFNNSPNSRCPLSIGYSTDGTKTWPIIRDLETDPSDGARYGYPAIIQARDGTIYCAYTNKHGCNIRCAVFDEDWLKNKK